MTKFATILFSGISLLASLVSGYANPGACSGVCVNTHDPSIIQSNDGTYFRFSTGGKIAVHSAPALEGPWTYRGAALPKGSNINLAGNQDLWAPDVIKHGNTFYLYYTVSSFGSQNSAIGVASSPSLAPGSWTDLGATGIRSDSSKSYNAIDAQLIQVDGYWLLTWGSFWSNLFQVRMASTPTRIASGATLKQVAFDPTPPQAVEGPFVFKYGSYYYLFYSKGKCCDYVNSKPAKGEEYRILACRSKSATGGFVDKSGVDCLRGGGTTVLASHGSVYGPGGQGVYNDPKKGPVLYYHYVNTKIGYGDGQKQFGWNTIDFSSGWPVV
ncbi:hypothetical protein ACHAQA_002998 [Verticillium albo-atrum]